MGPYTPRGSSAIRKAITYVKGDKRKISLRRCGQSVCYLITDERKVDIERLLKSMGEYIKVDNMDCVWDFIYEVGSWFLKVTTLSVTNADFNE